MSLKIENKLIQKSLLKQIEVKRVNDSCSNYIALKMNHYSTGGLSEKNNINHLARMNHRKILAPVVQRLDNTIRWLNCYPVGMC